jgi:hypothetical protein
MGVTQIKEWCNWFKNGRTSVDSDQRTGRPSTSRNPDAINKVCSLIVKDRRLTIREIANDIGSAKSLLNLMNGFPLGITKLLAKLDAVALFNAFQHCAQSKNVRGTWSPPKANPGVLVAEGGNIL